MSVRPPACPLINAPWPVVEPTKSSGEEVPEETPTPDVELAKSPVEEVRREASWPAVKLPNPPVEPSKPPVENIPEPSRPVVEFSVNEPP